MQWRIRMADAMVENFKRRKTCYKVCAMERATTTQSTNYRTGC